MDTLQAHGISCHPGGWSHDGPTLQHDEDHAFQYEVREFGNLIGWITADRARSHPGVMWECKRVGDPKPFAGDFKTVQEALTTFCGGRADFDSADTSVGKFFEPEDLDDVRQRPTR